MKSRATGFFLQSLIYSNLIWLELVNIKQAQTPANTIHQSVSKKTSSTFVTQTFISGNSHTV